MAKIHFLLNTNAQNTRKSVFFDAKTLIFIILKLTFCKKKKKMLGLRKNYVIINITKNKLINFDIELGRN